MTIGQRIRYIRKLQEMTQGELAAKSDIHPVSVRKYETDAMKPQPEQILRMAKALCVSYFALAGLDSAQFDPDSEPDAMSLLMILLNSGILEMDVPLFPHGDDNPWKATYKVGGELGKKLYVKIPGQDKEIPLGALELSGGWFTTKALYEWQTYRKDVLEAEAAMLNDPSEEAECRLKEASEKLAYQELDMQAHDLAYNDRRYEASKTREEVLMDVISALTEEEAPEAYAEYRALSPIDPPPVINPFPAPPFPMKHPEDWYDMLRKEKEERERNEGKED